MLMFLLTVYPFLAILLSLSLFFTVQFRRDLKFSGHEPPTYPIIGCLVAFYKNSHRLLDWYTDLLSDSATQTILIRRFGARRTIVTANPENVEHMLKTNFSNYPKGKPFTQILGDFLGCGIFNVDGELWHTQRKLASYEFSARSLREYLVNTLKEEVQGKLLPILESLSMEDDKVVDLQEVLRRFAFDIVCKVTLGVDPCCLDQCFSVSSVARAFDLASVLSAKRATEPLFVIWKIKRMLRVGSERRLKEAIEEIQGFVTEIVHEKKKDVARNREKPNGEDLLSKMIMAGLDDIALRDMVISLLMAGRDTTSAAMTWFFYVLSRHSDVEQQLVKEIEVIEDERLTDYETLKEMRFLEACLCESMRLYPPIAWDSKHAVFDDTLPDGTRVRAGDRVTYFPYGMGRMKEIWGKDRLEYKPAKRWLMPELESDGRRKLKKVCPYKFPIFHAGPRVCLGKDMAFIQMKYVVASVLKRFKIRPTSSDRPVFIPSLTAHMAGGFKVNIRRRRDRTTPKPID